MQFDMAETAPATRYRIVSSTITPRPIAWITSLSPAGVVNAAPYSFFNAVGAEPPLIALGLMKVPGTRALKNTAANILATGEFVVNLVSEDDAAAMNATSVDAPAEVSEVDYADLATLPSLKVAPPRIATSPVSFECRKHTALDIGTAQTVVLAEILVAHIADRFVTDAERVHLDTPAMRLIGRTHGAGWYARGTDQFQLDRPAYDPEWAAKRGAEGR
ncbi:hypothetical protein GCM10011380_17680 [Sphingomonas metalli]|uniref:Flavin reductase like domain-containing protein n=1 Tax=Sphingomonas metalli TaxID=1779358 RepID=A0A916T501_9SPHN|nr:flavin reductase family protein [Sphingomonas metalli]GGB28521.1 hypothetical protein GCM10011380_17680 [Sphingomonas metalli]